MTFPLGTFFDQHACVCAEVVVFRMGGGGGDMFCLLLINSCIMLVDKGFQRGWGPGRDGREAK